MGVEIKGLDRVLEKLQRIKAAAEAERKTKTIKIKAKDRKKTIAKEKKKVIDKVNSAIRGN